MNESHANLTDRNLGFAVAQNEPVPEDFIGECSGFPEKLLGFKGWARIGDFCRTHDWHYTILRHYLREWPAEKWKRFREWADEELHRKVEAELVKMFVFDRLAGWIAAAVFLVVRSKIGKMAAMGKI